jgi:hypothetical protein
VGTVYLAVVEVRLKDEPESRWETIALFPLGKWGELPEQLTERFDKLPWLNPDEIPLGTRIFTDDWVLRGQMERGQLPFAPINEPCSTGYRALEDLVRASGHRSLRILFFGDQ